MFEGKSCSHGESGPILVKTRQAQHVCPSFLRRRKEGTHDLRASFTKSGPDLHGKSFTICAS
jgi:hypothetical protein